MDVVEITEATVQDKIAATKPNRIHEKVDELMKQETIDPQPETSEVIIKNVSSQEHLSREHG